MSLFQFAGLFIICILALRALGTSWQGKVFGTDFGAGSGEDLAISRRVSHPEGSLYAQLLRR
jgi:hypothetical protein